MKIREERSRSFQRRPEGHANARLVYLSYKRDARSKGRDFDIEEQDFVNMTQANCFYCGSPPSNKHAMKGINGAFIYNGVDRVDNSMGYSVNNCVPCCKMCNLGKRNSSQGDFLKWAHRVASYSVSRIANY